MKKEKTYRFLYMVSALFMIGFAIRLGADFLKCDVYETSLGYPFVIGRLVEFMAPAIVFFCIGRSLQKRHQNDKV